MSHLINADFAGLSSSSEGQVVDPLSCTPLFFIVALIGWAAVVSPRLAGPSWDVHQRHRHSRDRGEE